MKTCLLVVFCIAATSLFAQDSSKAVPFTYKSYTSVPAFYLYSLDSTRFSTVSLIEDKEPLVIMYFSPTCSHCQHQTEEITSHIKELKKIKILMVSSHPLSEIRQFAETYAISHFPNITLAYDPEFGLGRFFDLKSLPGIFVYDKKAKLKKVFSTNTTVAEIIASLEE